VQGKKTNKESRQTKRHGKREAYVVLERLRDLRPALAQVLLAVLGEQCREGRLFAHCPAPHVLLAQGLNLPVINAFMVPGWFPKKRKKEERRRKKGRKEEEKRRSKKPRRQSQEETLEDVEQAISGSSGSQTLVAAKSLVLWDLWLCFRVRRRRVGCRLGFSHASTWTGSISWAAETRVARAAWREYEQGL
jgi:hypothetical protein